MKVGPFELDDKIGAGTFGDVYRAQHVASGTPVAVKILRSEHRQDLESFRMFKSEVRAVARLDHPGIVMILDYGQTDERAPYLAMELADGGSLARWVGKLDFAGLKPVLMEVLDALAHAHARGVTHRDLKPSNLLLVNDPERGGVRLADWGMADQTLGGTPPYMAPEQFLGETALLGPRTDLYGLACVAFTLITGRHLFAGPELEQFADGHLNRAPELSAMGDVPEGFETWMKRLLEKDPERRYWSAAEAAWALSRLEADQGPEIVPTRNQRGLVALSHLSRPGPPVPADWRRPEAPPPPLRLLGAGLSLFGLRDRPLAGRNQERDQLWRALVATAETGRCHALLIKGPVGVGKSRLARWLTERVLEVGAGDVVTARFTRLPDAGGGLAGGIRELLEDDPEGWLEAHDLAHLLPATLALLGAEQQTVVQQGFDERHDCIIELLAARRRLQVVFLDDVQFGSDGIALVERAAQLEHPILFVMTIDSDAGRPLEAAAAERIAEVVELSPLAEQTSAQMIRDLLHLEPQLAQRVAEQAEGVPLFAVELVRAWTEKGLLEVRPEGFGLADREEALPTEIRDLFDRQLHRATAVLGDWAGEALEIAAVLGTHVRLLDWAATVGQDVAPLQERLLASGLALEAPDGFIFSHALLRQALLTRAEQAGRLGDHHARIAETLEGTAGSLAETHLQEATRYLTRPLVAAPAQDSRRWAWVALIGAVFLLLMSATALLTRPEESVTILPVKPAPSPPATPAVTARPLIAPRPPPTVVPDASADPVAPAVVEPPPPRAPPPPPPSVDPLQAQLARLQPSDAAGFEAARAEIERRAKTLSTDQRRRVIGKLRQAERTGDVAQLEQAYRLLP